MTTDTKTLPPLKHTAAQYASVLDPVRQALLRLGEAREQQRMAFEALEALEPSQATRPLRDYLEWWDEQKLYKALDLLTELVGRAEKER